MSRKAATYALIATALMLTVTVSRADESDSTRASLLATASSIASYPPERTIHQSLNIGGKTLNYRVTAGAVPVTDESGNTIAAVTFVAYLLEDTGGDRPVTFAMNGGPGSASANLNGGGIGPKRLVFDPTSTRVPRWVDNPDSWLPFTDLVFIDPVGTGFSRSFLPPGPSRKAFYTYDSDIAYLSQSLFDWLLRHGRMGSEKHLVGESYSGYRAPRILEYLQRQLNVPFAGLVLVSPLMNQDQSKGIDTLPSPIPWIATLPTAAAAELERHGKLSATAMVSVEEYARSEYAVALLDGWRHPDRLAGLVDKLIPMTGLSREYLTQTGGRVEPHTYLREIYRRDGKLANYYDVDVSYPEPFPVPNDDDSHVEMLIDTTAPERGMGVADFITRVVGWVPPWRYMAYSRDVNSAFVWARGTDENESYSALRRILVENPRLKVLVAHGYTDIACPYFADVIALDQIPAIAGRNEVRMGVYPGGHMFYNRPESLAAFTSDARKNY
jgi:carboxypeptidase C (cathepsin A)